MQSIGGMPLEDFRKVITPKQYVRCENKNIETWYPLTKDVFINDMYSVYSKSSTSMLNFETFLICSFSSLAQMFLSYIVVNNHSSDSFVSKKLLIVERK